MTLRALRHPVWLLGPLTMLAFAMAGVTTTGAAPLEGSQGTDTSLPATSSQITVHGTGVNADLAITVNQTTELTNQAVSITWTGATPTVRGPGRFGSHFLQVMECWGDDDGTVPGSPGPPPEQCEQGATAGSYTGVDSALYPNGFTTSRIISRNDVPGGWTNYDPAVGVLDPRTTNVWLPFRGVDGTTSDIQTDPDFNPAVSGGNFWLNTSYNQITTNEIAAAATGPDGTGAELFQVLTGVQSTGLGCGQQTQPLPGGSKKVPTCWIVVVPRGSAADENAGTPFETGADQKGVYTSPVSPAAWQHRIAIPIAFNPVDSPCKIGAAERRISGSELAVPAVRNWQPTLCANGTLPPYSFSPINDATARQQLLSKSSSAPGMVVVSEPLAADSVNPVNPVVYAPISVSGLVIGFNIERNPGLDATPEEQQLAGVRIADLNLTPRLVAKLLTQSYRQAVNIASHPPGYSWTAKNPAHLGQDPDFLRFNPEFTLLQISDSRTFSSLELPAGNSDYARALWQWVLADPQASAWLAGQPDKWGMKVNPVYATTAAANSTGIAFADPVPNSFPKSDPYCYQAPPVGVGGTIVAPPLCSTDWVPYSNGLGGTARVTRAAADLAKINANQFALDSSHVWTAEQPQNLGARVMLAITDTPSAAQYGLQSARLSRAGDDGGAGDGDTRSFVAADSAGLTAGVAAMAPRTEPTVLQPVPAASAPRAYPLTTLTYAAIAPLGLDPTARSEYAAFLDYAAGPGQVPGLSLGQLPRGYAPLPASLEAQATAAANVVRTLTPTSTSTPTATPTPVTTTTTRPPAAPGSVTVADAAPASGASTPATAAATVTVATLATTESGSSQSGSSQSGSSRSGSSQGTTRSTTRATSKSPATATTTTTAVTEASTPTGATPTSDPGPITGIVAVAAATASPTTTGPTTTAAPGTTPASKLAGSRFAVPSLGVLALGSGLGALEIAKRPRRRASASPDVEGPNFTATSSLTTSKGQP